MIQRKLMWYLGRGGSSTFDEDCNSTNPEKWERSAKVRFRVRPTRVVCCDPYTFSLTVISGSFPGSERTSSQKEGREMPLAAIADFDPPAGRFATPGQLSSSVP